MLAFTPSKQSRQRKDITWQYKVYRVMAQDDCHMCDQKNQTATSEGETQLLKRWSATVQYTTMW